MGTRRLRIIFLNRSFAPDSTATGQLLAELASGLAAEMDVTVVTGHVTENDGKWVLNVRELLQGLWPKKTEWQGVTVFRCGLRAFPKHSLLGRSASYITYFLGAWIGLMRAGRAEVIATWTDPPIIGLTGIAWRLLRRCRFTLIVQDIFPEVGLLMDSFDRGFAYGLLDWLSKMIFRGADQVVAIGETMQERLIELKGVTPERISVIHNWEDTEARYPAPKRNDFSIREGLADKFVVMHAGNLGLSQDLDMLLSAAKLLEGQRDVRFVFLGDGTRRGELMCRATERGQRNVCFISQIPKHRLNEPYGSADVFVVSLKRGLAGFVVPSKVYGVLAAGRPYVAAVEDSCEVAAITKKYDCGLLSEPGDPEDLVAKILTLYRDRALAQRLGDNGRRASLRFDRKLQVCAYRDLFCRLALVSYDRP